ncbi:MAG TPA: NPCBM/NEW2 domain-containing protein, partial [Verrucomicrobiae bacterium]|nr:NPCBM/NEW2 domain-containing protein [Verrucomicrobiae bacterium]
MLRVFLGLAVFASSLSAWSDPVAVIPEGEKAALAIKIIDAYYGVRPATPPKKLHLVYFTPADRDPVPGYKVRLSAIMEDIRAFYREGMERTGFGPKTFEMDRDADGKLAFLMVKGKHPASGYPRTHEDRMAGDPVVGGKVTEECVPALKAAGISLDDETVLIFCNLADWNEKALTFRHHSPYAGLWDQRSGLCWAVDSPILNLDLITRTKPILNDGEYGNMSMGKHNTIFIGGIAHELGHAFALSHCGERWDEKALGTSIMGAGNHTYHDERRGEGKGSFLTMASAMRLASRPLFSGSDKNMATPPKLETCSLVLTTNLTRADLANRRGGLRVEGTVVGSPPVYGMAAFFDSLRDGGYFAPTATAVPDSQGRFALEVSDLAPCGNGELRFEIYHANGAVSERQLGFSVTKEGCVDLTQWEMRHTLEPIADAVAETNATATQTALRELEESKAPALAKLIARKLAATLDAKPLHTPADAPAEITSLSLGDARPRIAEVGWATPAANRIPANANGISPLLDCGKLYATGLFAHARSRYVFDLGGKWKELTGEAGLHTLQQPYGSV